MVADQLIQSFASSCSKTNHQSQTTETQINLKKQGHEPEDIRIPGSDVQFDELNTEVIMNVLEQQEEIDEPKSKIKKCEKMCRIFDVMKMDLLKKVIKCTDFSDNSYLANQVKILTNVYCQCNIQKVVNQKVTTKNDSETGDDNEVENQLH